MNKGGIEYSQEAARAVRIISVLAAPILALYTLLIILGIVPNDHLVSPLLAGSIAGIWVLLSIYYYFVPARSLTDELMRLGLIHILALCMFLFVFGFNQPFSALFILLFLASHLYLRGLGLFISIASFLGVAILDSLCFYPPHSETVLANTLSVFSVIFLGTTVVTFVSAQETKRRALLHSQNRERLQYNRLLTIINNLTDAAFTTDEKGTILMYNAACLDLLDTNDSLKAKNIGDVFQLTDTTNTPQSLIDILADAKKATRRDDLSHTYSDGESVRLEITYAPIRSSFSLRKKKDELGGYILIMRDVTKQKSLEEERDEFISVVSHELRTPITIVEGTLSNLDILINRTEKPNDKVIKDSVKTAHDQVLYLARMVNDLSTLSRAERGVADTPEIIDVAELLHTMHQRYEKDAEAHNLHLNLDLGHKLGSINVSRLYVEELLQNLITNAIKYTKEGSVTIIAKRHKDTVTFAIKDTGIGISRTDQNNIFNKFYRSEDYRIRETNGTGLGLYVSTKLAHKLHTRIELTSRLNHGSTFSFELPVE